jgi:hypothetical protein
MNVNEDEYIFHLATQSFNKLLIQSHDISSKLKDATNKYNNKCCKILLYSELKQLIKICKKMRIDIKKFLEIKYTIDFISELFPSAKYIKMADYFSLIYKQITDWSVTTESQIALIQQYCKE